MLPVAIVLGAIVVVLVALRHEREDRPYLVASFFAHVGATLAFLWFSAGWEENKRGDIDGYWASANGITRLVYDDPTRWLPEVVKLIAHRESDLTRLGMSEVPATAATHAWSGVAQMLSGGEDSITAGCLVVAYFSFVSKVLVFGVAKHACGDAYRREIALGTLFVPSVLFWTCGFVKEAYAIVGLGFAIHGIYGTVAHRRPWLAPLALLGIGIIASVKPYVLFPIVLGTAAWVLVGRGGKIRLGYVVVAVLVAFVGIALIGKAFPEFGVDTLNSSLAGTRRGSELSGGGSLVGDEVTDDAPDDRSFLANLAVLPLGLVNVFIRPLLFEVRGIPQLGAALENGFLLVTVLLLFRRHSFARVTQTVTRSPPLFAALVFAVTLASAVGLSSKNLGTVSRYRVPMMPAYVLTVGVLSAHFRRATARERARSPGPARVAKVQGRAIALRPRAAPARLSRR